MYDEKYCTGVLEYWSSTTSVLALLQVSTVAIPILATEVPDYRTVLQYLSTSRYMVAQTWYCVSVQALPRADLVSLESDRVSTFNRRGQLNYR
jgi:hypothetical protein